MPTNLPRSSIRISARAASWLSVLAFCAGTAGHASAQSVVDLGAGWHYQKTTLLADLAGPAVDEHDWTPATLVAPWGEQMAPGYDGILWYRRTVDLPAGVRGPVSLLLGPSRHGAYQVWADGTRVAEFGSIDRLTPFPQPRAVGIPATAAADGRIQLAIRFHRVGWLSDASGPSAGPFEGPALLGPSNEIARRLAVERAQARSQDLVPFLLGLALIGLGLVHLMLFARRGADRSYLFLGIGATALGTRAVVLTRWVAEPIDHLALIHRLGAILSTISVVALALFVRELLGRPLERWMRDYLLTLAGVTAFVALAPFHWVWLSDPFRLAWMVPGLAVPLAAILAQARAGHADARVLALGVAALGLGAALGLLRELGIALPSWTLLAGSCAALAAAALALTERSSRALAESAIVRRDLEHRLDQRTRALAELARAGERAQRAKTEFLANVSHELRTPLNAVIGFANVLLRKSTLEERDRDFLTRIRSNGEHLLHVVDDVLDLSRIEAGELEVRPEPVRLDEVARAAAAKHEAAAHAKALYLDVRISPLLASAQVDPRRLEQVLNALIGNAVKFTRHGGITVRAENEGGRPRAILVEDTGVGIAPEQMEAIFEPFQQGESGLAKRFAGTGLGLTIARSLCRMMGCELEVESQPGRGSCFRIALPRVPTRPRAPIPADVAEAIQGIDPGKLVLIIDDEPDARLLLEEHVRSFGMRAVSAEGGLEGLRLARELKPDLVTLDLKMPGMDGWATLRAFRADPALREVPIVVVSVVAAEARGTILGQVDLLGKPVDRDALADAIRRNLKGRSSRALVVDDDPDSRLLLGTLLEDSVEEVRTAADGSEALALLEGYDPGVILLDLVMPSMDGMTFLRALREHPRHARVPVLVVTSKELTEAETAALDRVTAGVVRKAPGSTEPPLRERLAGFLDASRN